MPIHYESLINPTAKSDVDLVICYTCAEERDRPLRIGYDMGELANEKDGLDFAGGRLVAINHIGEWSDEHRVVVHRRPGSDT